MLVSVLCCGMEVLKVHSLRMETLLSVLRAWLENLNIVTLH